MSIDTGPSAWLQQSNQNRMIAFQQNGTKAQGPVKLAFFGSSAFRIKAPSGMTIYSGKLWPEWSGDFFVGSLKFGLLSRLERTGSALTEAERIEGPETERVRDVVEAPDGSIWFLSVGQGAAYRMTPG